MKRQKWKFLLFVDNAPCHPDTNLSNIEGKFLPPNTMSFTHPIDQGIIQVTKVKCRKEQVGFKLIYNLMKYNSTLLIVLNLKQYPAQNTTSAYTWWAGGNWQ